MDKRVLTIQDISCIGQCSLTVALPIISACGIETAILPSSVLSNHTAPGFNGFTFHDLTSEMPLILKQWQKNNTHFDAFYTGYVSKAQIPLILDIIQKTGKSDSLKIVDPVMADNGKLYSGFDSDFPFEMLKLCQNADFILPNLTEAALLLGEDYVGDNYNQNYIEQLCARLHKKTNSKNIIITGVSFEKSKLGVAVYDAKTVNFYFTEKLPASMHGTGDVFASAFTGALLSGKTPLEAASLAADFVVLAMKKTLDDSDHWYGVKFEKALPELIKRI